MSVIKLAILGLLSEREQHGYELKKRLQELPGQGLRASFGSLYPALAKLEATGDVKAAEGAGRARPVTPMSGSLSGEAAIFRALRNRPPRSSRRRKVYAITDQGREHLAELLMEDITDDRAFPVQVAFCGVLPPADRLRLFERRHARLAAQLAAREPAGEEPDLYRRALLERDGDALANDLAWLEGLIDNERSRQGSEPTEGDPR